MNKSDIKNQGEEYCILCHKCTGVDFATDIGNREYYIRGCGQLCKDCYNELYSRQND